jgi:hypothetical protein
VATVHKYGDPGENYPIKMEFRRGRMERISVADVMERVAVWAATYR